MDEIKRIKKREKDFKFFKRYKFYHFLLCIFIYDIIIWDLNCFIIFLISFFFSNY